MSIAGVHLGQHVLNALGRGALDLVLKRRTPGMRSSSDISAGTNPEEVVYNVKGRRTDEGKYLCFTVYGAQLPVGVRPMKDDTITDGEEVFMLEEVQGSEGIFYCYTTDLEE